MLITEDIIRYIDTHSPSPTWDRFLWENNSVAAEEINLKGLYKHSFDETYFDPSHIESLMNSNIFQYFEYIGEAQEYTVLYFENEKDMILWRLKYGI